MQTNDQNSIILFDGVCNLCNSSVKFILKRDKKKQFIFASLQSDAAENILLHHKYKKNGLNSIILIHRDKLYEKSSAVLNIFRVLGMPWRLFSVFYILPLSWRDFLYDFIAQNRYKWFGKKDSCIMMLPKHKNRFIQ
jgi:predicted DCC family thiol-disulfide oxidoreductase YuxK